MELISCEYIVERIDGDYAMLKNIRNPEDGLKQVARALLPMEIMEGTKLLYEMLQYTIVDYSILKCRAD